MASTACYPNKLKPCVACICVNIKFTSYFMDASTSYLLFSFTSFFNLFIRNCTFFFILLYTFTVNVGSKRAITFPDFSLVGGCDVSYTISVSFTIPFFHSLLRLFILNSSCHLLYLTFGCIFLRNYS